MKVVVNKKLMRREWVLEKWYEKTLFAVAEAFALFYIVVFTVSFLVGFIQGLAE